MDIFTKIETVFGGQTELAKLLGTTSQCVSNWKVRGRIPAERCPDIVRLSHGQITYNDLRPDLWPLVRPDTAA
jgi:DNA-binding transcriptional regulator YdaS (Cro superfamily)